MDLPFLVSYLQLCSVTLERSGDYTCVVSNGFTTASSTVQLSVYGECIRMHVVTVCMCGHQSVGSSGKKIKGSSFVAVAANP